MVGEDGFALLDALDAPDAPEAVRTLPSIATLRRTWQRHYERTVGTGTTTKKRAVPRVRFKANRDLPPAAEGIESLWQRSMPVLDDPPPVKPYAPGTWGPNAIHQLIAPHAWRLPFERSWRVARTD